MATGYVSQAIPLATEGVSPLVEHHPLAGVAAPRQARVHSGVDVLRALAHARQRLCRPNHIARIADVGLAVVRDRSPVRCLKSFNSLVDDILCNDLKF